MFGALFLSAAAFAFADPAGDAHGDGQYILPTRPPISADALDLREFKAETNGKTMQFTVGFGSTGNAWNLRSGFSDGVTDIFVRGGLGGESKLDSLNLAAANGGWQYHLRITGAGSRLERFAEGGAAPSVLEAPKVTLQGTNLLIDTQIPAGDYGYWVTSSVYSPLTPDGLLRPIIQASPTALQVGRANAPVPVDVLAAAGDGSAYTTGQLASVGQTHDSRPWWLLGLGAVGLILTVLTTLRLWRQGR